MRPSRPSKANPASQPPRHGLARVLSKLGVCSRSQAEKAVREGRVRVDGKVVLDPERPADAQRQRITLDGEVVAAEEVGEVFTVHTTSMGHRLRRNQGLPIPG